MRNFLLVTIAAATMGAAAVTGTVQGLASCGAVRVGLSAGLATAPLVFVGTVTGTADQDRTATVHVDEVWTGQHLPPEVILRGSPDAGAAATSVDRHYQGGRQYLFVPVSVSGPPYDDNACTMTRDFAADVAALRPTSVIRYPAAPAGPPLLPLAAVAVAIVGGGIYAISRIRTRRA